MRYVNCNNNMGEWLLLVMVSMMRPLLLKLMSDWQLGQGQMWQLKPQM